ncbi:MAG TPA: PTS transporter subunit EIIB, partial [Vicinamibacterales bacterium]
RLRVELVDHGRANPDRLKALGAAGVVQVGNSLQAIFGTRSENLKSDMEEYLRAGGAELAALAQTPAVDAPPARAGAPDPEVLRTAASISLALGGGGNIRLAEGCAQTRVRVQVVDPALVNGAALSASGVTGVMRLDGNVLHLIVGPNARDIASALNSAPPVVTLT